MDPDETTATTPPAPAKPTPDPQAEAASLRKQLKQANDLNTSLNGQLAELPGLKNTVRELQNTIRSGRYKERVRELGSDLKDGALDLVWDKLGLDTSAELPDDAALTTALDAARQKFGALLFNSTTTETAKVSVQAPPAHAGRGVPSKTGAAASFICKASDHRNPKWVKDNAAAIAEARKNKTYKELPE